ncbi:hypothetical protein GGX14DRAFT_405381 [Mycena pura]|uniref:Uncharacterized protein n=1 Tax=Mycena pura TaxID=153505 RepID=A0AAD6Y4D6_9AGAR|nr:hypothetical protein GGX14DRAFT_405381 [Mycena pura]
MPEKIYKVTKYDEFARFWNRRVTQQSPAELDSSKRIYFKLPEQLERHHKKSIQWKTTRATLIAQGCRSARNHARACGGQLRSRSPAGTDLVSALVGVDLSSFNPTAMRQQLRAQRAVYTASAAIPSLEPAPVQPEEQPLAQPEVQQTILAFAPTEHDGDYELMEVERPTKKARAAAQQADPGKKRAERRCALCAHAKCGQELTCKGKGGREKCGYKNQPSHGELGFDVATRKRHHRTRGS